MAAAEYKPTEEEMRFKKYHDSLRAELNRAHWHFTVWKYLRELAGKYNEEFDQASSFLMLTADAHMLATIIGLYKICDADPETVNIHKFLNFVEQNRAILFSDQSFKERVRGGRNYKVKIEARASNPIKIDDYSYIIAELRNRFGTFPESNLKKIRDKTLAHIDRKSVVKGIDLFQEYPVTISQIEEIIEDIDEALNGLSEAYDGDIYIKDIDANIADIKNGMDVIMDSIRFSIQERKPLRSSNKKAKSNL